MKMKLLKILLLLIFIIIIKYFYSSYAIKYNIDNFSIIEKYEGKVYYFEITYKDITYNFKIYHKRKIRKKLIDNIDYIENGDYQCIYPKSKIKKTYPLCYQNEEGFLSYNLINDEKLSSYFDSLKIRYFNENYEKNSEFKFMDNLNENEYVAVWKYNGYYLLNKDGINSIDLFSKDRYSNDLAFQLDNKIIMPNYDEELIFSNFIILDIRNGKHEKFESKYEISYDSYVAGSFKNNIYLFDNKNEKLYKINLRKRIVELIGEENKGFIKIIDGKLVKSSLKEYKNKITFYDLEKEDLFVNKNYKYYKENKKIKVKFLNEEEVNIVKINKDNIYYIKDDNFYIFNSITADKLILHYFELNFNDKNRLFIYIEN